jgi:hypothetical protein
MDLNDIDVSQRQVWLRAFYGFDPEGSGYLGFTREGQRQDMMAHMNDGDVILIYGAVESLTQSDLRAQALGFLEIELIPCTDRERMSDEAYQWKLDRGFADRWTHGITVRRAWRTRNRVGIATIAPDAYESKHRFTRTTKAILLRPDERVRALSHPVVQVNVFGEAPIAEVELGRGTMETVLRPSKGILPALGQRTSTYEDGDNVLYLMMLSANADAFLRKGAAVFGHALVKVGRTNDIARRVKEVNCGFPERACFRWQAIAQHEFSSVADAHDAETELKKHFAERFTSQGNEFFSGDGQRLKESFFGFCAMKSPKILGAPRRAKGL